MGRPPATLLSGLVLALLTACHGAGVSAGSAGEAGPVRPIPSDVIQARLRLRAHDTTGALALLREDDPLSEATAERSWLLARIWAERTDGVRARAAARALPPSAYRTALLESLAEDPAAALDRLRQVRERQEGPWLHLAASYLHQFRSDAGPAQEAAARARGRGWAFVDVEAHLVAGRATLLDGNFGAALRHAEAALHIDPTDARAHELGARAELRAGHPEGSARLFFHAMAQVPASERYPRELAELLRRFSGPKLSRDVGGWLSRLGTPLPNAEYRALLGLLAERRGAEDEAVPHYETALAAGANPIPVERDLRRLLSRRGDYRRSVQLLLAAVPRSVREDPANLLGGAWAELEQAVRGAPDRRAGETERLRLARALVQIGALQEAEGVLRGLVSTPARVLGERLAAQLAFVTALEDYVERGYRAGDRIGGRPPDFATVVGEVCRLARTHLSADEAAAFADPTLGARHIPLVGDWLDHGTDPSSGVVAHFRRYGLYLVLGRRGDQPPEAILYSLALLSRDQGIRTRGGCYRQDVAVGYDRRLRPFAAALGGDIGGACLPDGIYLDLDAVRAVEHDVRRGVERDAGLVAAARRGPRLLEPDTIDGVFALTETAGVGERLALRYLARTDRDRWGSYRTLRAHEYGHLVEIRRHLPLGRNLLGSAALVLGSGLSISGLEQEVERRAQLAAVAESGDPDLALAEMLLVLPVHAREAEAHEGGYREATAQLVRHVWSHPDAYPQIDRRFRVLPQLDRLTNDEIQQAARAILPR